MSTSHAASSESKACNDACGDSDPTALIVAARGGCVSCVERLLEDESDVLVDVRKRGLSALDAAIKGNHWEIARQLQDAGAIKRKY